MTLDWTNAGYANGPKIVAWLESTDMLPDHLHDSTARRFYSWRMGGQATYDAVDRVLVSLGMHPSEAPDDMWEERTPRIPRPERLEQAVALYRTGANLSQCERQTGIHPRRLKAEAIELGIYRGSEGSNRPISEEKVVQIRELRQAGMSRRATAIQLGLSTHAVKNYEQREAA